MKYSTCSSIWWLKSEMGTQFGWGLLELWKCMVFCWISNLWVAHIEDSYSSQQVEFACVSGCFLNVFVAWKTMRSHYSDQASSSRSQERVKCFPLAMGKWDWALSCPLLIGRKESVCLNVAVHPIPSTLFTEREHQQKIHHLAATYYFCGWLFKGGYPTPVL